MRNTVSKKTLYFTFPVRACMSLHSLCFFEARLHSCCNCFVPSSLLNSEFPLPAHWTLRTDDPLLTYLRRCRGTQLYQIILGNKPCPTCSPHSNDTIRKKRSFPQTEKLSPVLAPLSVMQRHAQGRIQGVDRVDIHPPFFSRKNNSKCHFIWNRK